jgi:TolB-like protein/DNA-binding SARP family transcriptional activator
LELYQGPFLDGFFLSDAPDFERWADAERERLARAFGGALERLAEEATAEGDAKSAVEAWRRLAAEDPYNSRVTVRLLEALEAAGDRAGALRQARIHATLLEQEFGAEPDPEVTAVAERIGSGPATSASRGRVAGVREGKAPVAVPLTVVENETVPPESTASPEPAPIPVHALGPRTRGRLLRGRAVGLLGALIVGSSAVFALGWLLPGTSARSAAATEAAAASPKALAVLPFVNLSRDPEEEYFSDGLTEELIGVLSQLKALRVAARTSAFAFKGENRDIREIGRALNVGTVLEGSVRRVGDRIRVTAQLISAADGFHLWSRTYEREGTDIFAIQSELALRIASALEAQLTPAERARLARRPTTSPDAHVLYLRGRYFWNQRTRSGFVRAIDYFERATEVDPQYAAAYAGLAMAYSLQGLSGDLPPQEALERMREAALEALELDDGLAEAHAALGAYLNVFAWDSEASEQAYRRAIELDPSYGTARHLYGNLLGAMGRLEEAVAQKTKASELDPLAPQPTNSLGSMLLAAGHPEEAHEAFRTVLELDSTYWQAHAGLGAFYETTGQLEEAIHAHQRAVELASTNANARSRLARVLARAGRKDEAGVILGQLQGEAAASGIYPPVVAAAFVALDDVDGALEWLERSYRQRHPQLRFLDRRGDPRLADDPRYLDLLRRIGLPD